MAIDVSTGTTVTFGTSSFSMPILSVGWAASRGTVQTSHMGTTTAHTHQKVDLYDPGELTLEVQYNQEASIPITGAAETITITWPGAGAWTVSGFCTSADVSAGLEELMTATLTFKLTGAITF